jgi:hypothetical protein
VDDNSRLKWSLFLPNKSDIAKAPVDRQHLKEWGRLAYVTKRDKIKPKLTPKAIKCIFLGYTASHISDAYYFHCTTTNRAIISRDAKWLDWHGNSALNGITHLVEAEKTLNDSSTGGITIERLDDSDKEDTQLGRENATPEPIAQPPTGRNEPPAGREETADEETAAPDSTCQERVARELRKLDTFYNPTENATETVLQVSLSSDPGTPRNGKEARTCEERDSWKAGRDKEYDNFNKRNAWKEVDRAHFPTKRSWE